MQASYKLKHFFLCLRLFVVVYKLVNVVVTLEWYCVPLYQGSQSGTLTQPSYRHNH